MSNTIHCNCPRYRQPGAPSSIMIASGHCPIHGRSSVVAALPYHVHYPAPLDTADAPASPIAKTVRAPVARYEIDVPVAVKVRL